MEINSKREDKRRWGWLWLLIGIGLGFLAACLILILQCQGEKSTPTPPDTSSVEIDSTGKIIGPELPDEVGEAEPIRDTIYRTEYKLYWPDWMISYLHYRDDALKLVALRKLGNSDSVEARSLTYHAPQGFQVQVGEDIRVDTFPHSKQPELKSKPKILRLSGLAEFDTQDGIGAGIELSAWRMIRLQGLVGVGRICHEVGVAKFPSNEKAPWVRLRLQVALP